MTSNPLMYKMIFRGSVTASSVPLWAFILFIDKICSSFTVMALSSSRSRQVLILIFSYILTFSGRVGGTSFWNWLSGNELVASIKNNWVTTCSFERSCLINWQSLSFVGEDQMVISSKSSYSILRR